MPSILETLFEHNTWANLGLLDACAVLTEAQLNASVPGVYGSVGDTLTHLVAAQERYHDLLTGEASANPVHESAGFPGLPALRQSALRSGEGLTQAAAQARPDDILRGTRRGEPYAIPASTVLLQVINHATEHRIQVATVMTQQGVQPPDLDGWSYGEDVARRRDAGASA